MRPFFENVFGVGVEGISLLMLLFGIANCIGTSLSSLVLKASLKLTLALGPLGLACCAGGLQVAVIQLANTAGAAVGGYVLDTTGARDPIAVSGLLLGATFLIVAPR